MLTDVPRDFDDAGQDIADFQVNLTGLTTRGRSHRRRGRRPLRGRRRPPTRSACSRAAATRSLDDRGPRLRERPRRRRNCTTLPDRARCDARAGVAPSTDALNALFTVPGENLLGVFNTYTARRSYLGATCVDEHRVHSQRVLPLLRSAARHRAAAVRASALPGLLFALGDVGTSYNKYGKSAETAADGGAFIICPLNPSEDCQLFARTCATDADCADDRARHELRRSARRIPYCHSPGEARDDALLGRSRHDRRARTPIPLDVLANDSLSESACVDPHLNIISVCGDGVSAAVRGRASPTELSGRRPSSTRGTSGFTDTTACTYALVPTTAPAASSTASRTRWTSAAA